MSEVTLNVGGRNYTVSCAAGEEAHVAKLGAAIDDKMRQLGEIGRSPDAQNLLFAGLLLADELHETKKHAAGHEQSVQAHVAEKAEMQRAVDAANGRRDELQTRIADLESELDGLQSAQQAVARDREADQAKLSGALEQTESLTRDLAASSGALSEAQSELAAVREAAASMPSSSTETDAAIEGDLAPALEGFADLLEECAAKLEARG